MATAPRSQAALDKRRTILDAAVRVFARQGFHGLAASRTIAGRGRRGVRDSSTTTLTPRTRVLDTLFLERWDIMLAAIAEVDARELEAAGRSSTRSHRSSWTPIAYDPDLMKVIIVEVTRRGELVRPHPPGKDPRGLPGHRRHRAEGAGLGHLQDRRERPVRGRWRFYGAIEQVLTGWIFDLLPREEEDYDQAKRFRGRNGVRAGSTPPPV